MLIGQGLGRDCGLNRRRMEDYQEPEVKKKKPKIPSSVSPLGMMDIEEMIKTISQAGYLVKKGFQEGCG